MPMATAFADLPLDLVMGILSWLPVEILMRLRCVCKTWKSLILHPTFVNLHLQRSSKNTKILIAFFAVLPDSNYDHTRVNINFEPFSVRRLLENPLSTLDEVRRSLWNPLTLRDMFYRFNSAFYVLGVCNGLACNRTSYWDGQYEEYWVQFWNPATGFRSLYSPILSVRSCNRKILQYAVKHGFGYDDSSQTYKVVAIIFDFYSKFWEIRVYCKGDTCWRRVLTRSSPYPVLQRENGAFVSGTLNWLALRISVSSDPLMQTVANNGSQSVIFSYDLKNETYRYMSIPDGLSEVSHGKCYLGVLSGCLCLSHDHNSTYFVVWLKREFGAENSWTQLLKVNYAHLQDACPPLFSPIPLCMSETGDILLLTNHGRGRFILLDQEDDRVDHIENFKSVLSFESTLLSFENFVESLVLPY